MATGIVRTFNESKGFGLITPDTGGAPIFAHVSAINAPGLKKLKVTQWVEYEIEERPEGLAAKNIRPLA